MPIAFIGWLRSLRRHGGPHRLVVVVEGVGGIQGALAAGWSLARDALDHVLLDHGPLREVRHCGALLHFVRPHGVPPVAARLLKLSDALLESLLLPHEVLNLLERVLSREVLENHEPFPQILVLVLQLEDLRVLIVNQL